MNWQGGIHFFADRKTKGEDLYLAQIAVAGWLQGRRQRDEVDMALGLALRDARRHSGQQGASDRQRGRAAAVLKQWMAASPHLPKDLCDAVRVLMPEIGQLSLADLGEWSAGLHAHPDDE